MPLASSSVPRDGVHISGPAPDASSSSTFPPSLLTLLVGHGSRGAVERLILEAAARSQSALVVCGDNRLDAYRLLAQARAVGLEDAVADGVLLARAFTVHQFVALIDETLPLMARERDDVGVAIVTGLLGPFLAEDVRDAESRTLLTRCLRALVAWTATTGFPVVATTRQADSARASDLLALARGVVWGVYSPEPSVLKTGPQTRIEAFATVTA
ncbi:MAG: hypothetical protein WDA16_13480 [Candidatus Thermoplasmatota archaeon]